MIFWGRPGPGAEPSWTWGRTVLDLGPNRPGPGAEPSWTWGRTVLDLGPNRPGPGAEPSWTWGRTALDLPKLRKRREYEVVPWKSGPNADSSSREAGNVDSIISPSPYSLWIILFCSQEYLVSCDEPLTEQEMQELMEDGDVNRDGRLDFDEFKDILMAFNISW
ncbi:Hypp6092 [Branchiostoma lanceolatum]|uniref:Hypp6092 protein n=1 Tax=Branchiostoma lanceolatum TaxID=7740 RepID=A0A8J9W5T3_BRALA|nr:Hypp6092 [Branchiostoma lanceolatum]